MATTDSRQPNEDTRGTSSRLVSRVAGVSIGALASRVTGFVRTAAIGAALGAGVLGDAYASATMLPTVFYEIILGGIGTAILVPFIMAAVRSSAREGIRLAQRLLTVGASGFVLLAVLVTLLAPLAVPRLGTVDERSIEATVTLTYFAIPAIAAYGIGGIATAILNARGRFSLPAWSPAINNLLLIAASAVLLVLDLSGPSGDRVVTFILGAAILAGALAQCGLLLFAVYRSGVPWRWGWQPRRLQLRSLGGLLGWMLLYVTAGQASALAIIVITRANASSGGPGTLVYYNAWIILMMAFGVVALPVITALTPAMSQTTDTSNVAGAASAYSRALRFITVMGLPVMSGMALLGVPAAIVLFQWGNYSYTSAVDTGVVISVAAASLVPYAVAHLQLFAFLAVGEARTPTLIVIAASMLRLAACVAVFLLAPPDWVPAGLMAANALGYIAAAILGHWALRRRLPLQPQWTQMTTMRLVAGALGATAIAAATLAVLHSLLEWTTLGAGFTLVASGGLLLSVYALALARLRPDLSANYSVSTPK